MSSLELFFCFNYNKPCPSINEGKMANSKITEGVGRKIVEALKMQSGVEITTDSFENNVQDNVQNNIQEDFQDDFSIQEDFEAAQPSAQPSVQPTIQSTVQPSLQPDIQISEPNDEFDDNIFNEEIHKINIPNDIDGFEIPSNVAVLKQLISKLPTGVTKQTGALIIKQTMEALGISMKSVLQEAQQVQEGLNNSARECQASIMEYKRQIGILEKQAQKYQRQYAALNDIISLFVQTNI